MKLRPYFGAYYVAFELHARILKNEQNNEKVKWGTCCLLYNKSTMR